MLINFLEHGTGDAKKAANYLLAEKDHTGKPRAMVRVLRGDPHMVATVANSLLFKHKYKSGVIAFAPEDNPTEKQKQEVLNLFEKVAWAGLDPERYAWSAVEHQDENGHTHIHILTARVDLETGKSLNIAPPGRKGRSGVRMLGAGKIFDPVRDFFNRKYNWARPDDPNRARVVQLGNSLKYQGKQNPREVIASYLVGQINKGRIKNRSDIVKVLQNKGIEIKLERKNHITVYHPKTRQPLRLKGKIFRDSWRHDGSQIDLDPSPGTKKKAAGRATEAHQGDKDSLRNLQVAVTALHRRRAAYNFERYGANPEPGIPELPELPKLASGSTITPGGASGTGSESKCDHVPVSAPESLPTSTEPGGRRRPGPKIYKTEIDTILAELERKEAHAMRQAEIRAKSIEKQHSALRADKYRIIVMFDDERKTFNFGKGRGENGEEKFYTFDELLKYHAKLAQLNANGGNIFITPFSDTYDYIFVDDLYGAKKDKFLKAGYKPCLLQTSSPYNHQAVLRIEKSQHGQGTLNRYFRKINAKFGDPKIAGQVHPFRLAGFANRKEKHKTKRGFPFVKVVAAADVTCGKAAAELESVAKQVEAETTDKPRFRVNVEAIFEKEQGQDFDIINDLPGSSVTAGPLLKPLSRRQPNSRKLRRLPELYCWMEKKQGELPDQFDRRFAAYVLVGRNADVVDIEQFLMQQIRERYPDKTDRTRYIQTVIYEAGRDFFHEQQHMYASRYPDPDRNLGLDLNRVDWQAGKDMIMRGFSPAQVERYILETADRHHDPSNYAKRTVVNFFTFSDTEHRFKSPLHKNWKLINTEIDLSVCPSDKPTFNPATGRELYPGEEKLQNNIKSVPERTFKRNIHAPAPA